MGVQISIEIADLIAAGWETEVVEEIVTDRDDEGKEIEVVHKYLLIKKGPHTFGSYVADCFVADCNVWGSNRTRFEQAGLFLIPHIIG